MSTTVSYKGETLTTVSNATKTLQTEGKYLEDDITLVDVSGGGAVLTTKNISANGTYNASSDSADGYSQVTVAVPASAVDTGTKSITANGNNQDVVGYAAVNVNVPNSYSAGDEGKVVSSGALVAQTAHADVTPTTSDQTIDTTTNDSIKVKGDANLVAGNIKKDVEIFGTTGSYEGGGGGISVDDIAQNLEPSGDIVLDNSVTQIGAYAFAGKPVTSVTGASVTSIGEYAFRNTTIAHVIPTNFPNLTGNPRGFSDMPSLIDIKLTSAVSLISGSGSIRNCANLEKIEFPNALANATGATCFRDNAKLALADMGGITSIGNQCFYGCPLLRTIVLRRTDAVCTLAGWNSTNMGGIYNNPSASTIYVPNSLISSYQSASNWSSAYTAGVTFAKIEGSIYE